MSKDILNKAYRADHQKNDILGGGSGGRVSTEKEKQRISKSK